MVTWPCRIAVAVLAAAISTSACARTDAAPAGECSDCPVVIVHEGTLTGGWSGLDGGIGPGALMADGRMIFVYWSNDAEVHVADLERDRVRRIMREGSGPNEVRMARAVHRSWSDTLFVYDGMNARMNVLAPDGAHVRSFPMNAGLQVNELIQLRSGAFVVNAMIRARERRGLALHLVDRSGSIVRSFGAFEQLPNYSDEMIAARRLLALDNDGSFLSVQRGSYVIERWSADGDSLGAWDVAPDWFTPKDRFMAMSPDEAPPPRAMGLQIDAAGRVWVLAWRPGANWRDGVRPPRRPPAVIDVVSYDRYIDTQIEVFDGVSMTRLASLRFDAPLGQFIGPGIAMTAEATVRDEPVVHFWRMRLPD